MKKIFFILSFILLSGIILAQDDGVDDNDRMQDKLKEYIQKRLGLTRNEANRLGPVFGRYLLEQRKIRRELSSDPLLREKRIVELRLHYRDDVFRPIIGEQRAGKVFIAEKEFREHVLEMLRNRRENLQDNRQKGRIRSQIQ